MAFEIYSSWLCWILPKSCKRLIFFHLTLFFVGNLIGYDKGPVPGSVRNNMAHFPPWNQDMCCKHFLSWTPINVGNVSSVGFCSLWEKQTNMFIAFWDWLRGDKPFQKIFQSSPRVFIFTVVSSILVDLVDLHPCWWCLSRY